MSDHECGAVRERIPELVQGHLDGARVREVEAHLVSCAGCAREREVVEALIRSRPAAPTGLADRIRERLEAEEARSPGKGARGWGGPSPWWGVAAAAVAALALGIGTGGSGPSEPEPLPEVPAFAAEAEEGAVWLSGDGEIAGAPLLEDLTEEVLLQFLEELEAGGVA